MTETEPTESFVRFVKLSTAALAISLVGMSVLFVTGLSSGEFYAASLGFITPFLFGFLTTWVRDCR